MTEAKQTMILSTTRHMNMQMIQKTLQMNMQKIPKQTQKMIPKMIPDMITNTIQQMRQTILNQFSEIQVNHAKSLKMILIMSYTIRRRFLKTSRNL